MPVVRDSMHRASQCARFCPKALHGHLFLTAPHKFADSLSLWWRKLWLREFHALLENNGQHGG